MADAFEHVEVNAHTPPQGDCKAHQHQGYKPFFRWSNNIIYLVLMDISDGEIYLCVTQSI